MNDMPENVPFEEKELIIIVHNLNNLPVIDFHELKELQGDLKITSPAKIEKLKNSIRKYGIFVPKFIWIDNGTYYIEDGHQTIAALRELEKGGYTVPHIPYVEIHAKNRKDAGEKLLMINSKFADINPETSFFKDFNIELEFMEAIEIPELELDLDPLGEAIIEDEAPEVPEDPITQVGNLWLCGKHRVLCGDSTKAADVGQLMEGKKADMVFSDPPYGMGKDFENDNLENQEGFNKLWLATIKETVKGGILLWYKPAALDQIIIPARAIGLKQVDYFHLYKPNDIAFPRNSWIRISESMIMFTNGEKIKYNEIKPYAHDTYLWNHTTKDKSFFHPSVKPIEVVTDVISRIKADTIADFFLGSGTTLIAAHQLNRICYGMEIVPKYVDVICQRFFNLTGIDPVRESDGKKWREMKQQKLDKT